MKLFRRRKPEGGEGEDEKELALDIGAEEPPLDQGATEAEASTDAPTPEAPAAADAQAAAPASSTDLLAQIDAETTREMEAAEKAPESGAGPPQGDDLLDPNLLELFREAKNEVVESTLASELEDIPIEDLLSDLTSVSRGLGITPRAGPRPTVDQPERDKPRPRNASD